MNPIDRKLIKAVRDGNAESIENLLDEGADVNVESNEGHLTPLMIAIREENLPVVMILLNRGAEVNPILPNGATPLMFASQKTNSPEIVAELLNRGANVEASLRGGRTSLILAIQFSRIDNAKTLLEGGANPNSEDIDGKTALMWAAQKSGASRDTTIVKDLIRRGADIDAVDNRSNTVLDYSSSMKKPISKILEQAREEIREMDSLTQAMSELTLEESSSQQENSQQTPNSFLDTAYLRKIQTLQKGSMSEEKGVEETKEQEPPRSLRNISAQRVSQLQQDKESNGRSV